MVVPPSRRFDIPSRDDDLLEDNTGFYVVRDSHMDADQCNNDLQSFSGRVIDDRDWRAILHHFDGIFCMARYNSLIDDWELVINAVVNVVKCLRLVVDVAIPEAVSNVLDCDGKPSEEILEECGVVSDALLMNVYLLSRLVGRLEHHFITEKAGAEKKTRKPVTGSEMDHYVKVRAKIIALFTEICQFTCTDRDSKIRQGAVKYLWRPADVHKGMVKTFIDTVFTFMDDGANLKVSIAGNWMGEVFGLVRVICIKFDHFHPLIEKMMSLTFMADVNEKTNFMVDAIIKASVNNDMDPLLSHMVHYVGARSELTPGYKPYSNFITGMGVCAAHVLVKHLTSVVPFLERDPASMRSAVLAAFGNLIQSKSLSEENCHAQQRLMTARDKMLDKLMDHLADKDHNVRARVLTIWKELVLSKSIPLSRLRMGLISKIGMRLLDKIIPVRKNALTFLSAFLQKNPYGHDFSYDLHKKELQVAMQRRSALEKRNPEYEGVAGAERIFAENSQNISETVLRWVLQYMDGSAAMLDIPDTSTETLVAAVASQLLNKMNESVQLFVQLVFTHKIPAVHITEAINPEMAVLLIMEQLKDVFVRDQVAMHIQNDEELLDSEEKREDFKNAVKKVDQKIEWLKDKMVIELEIEECLPMAMRSVQIGESKEMEIGIQFVVELKNFMIRGADEAVRQLCSLIWRNNAEIRKHVLDAAQKMFLSSHKEFGIQNKSTATNLLNVVEGMSDEERACVEEVICLMAINSFPLGALKQIWSVMNLPHDNGQNDKKKLVALRLLGILARANQDGLRQQLRAFQRFIRDPLNSPHVKAEAVAAIANLAGERAKDADIMQPVFRIHRDDSLFSTIETFMMEEFLRSECSSNQWFHVMRNVLTILFGIARDTNRLVCRLVAKTLFYTRRVTEWRIYYECEWEKEDNPEKKEALAERRSYWTQMCLQTNERMLALSGEIALRCAVFADVTFIRELRRLSEVVKMVKRGDIPSAKCERALTDVEHRSAMQRGIFDYANVGNDNTGSNIEEDEDIRTRQRGENLVDRKMFKPGRILSRLLPYVIYSMRAKNSPTIIRNAATLAFTKFMIVNKDLGKSGAPFFFSYLTNGKSAPLRSNLMIAVSDLCMRIANVVEEFAIDMYSMTRDTDESVRETSLLILNHLTTNQMIKMRGSIADIARGILDDSPYIQSLTKEFFSGICSRNIVTLYNLMPDFVSRLSRNPEEVSLAAFKRIMSYLVGLVRDKTGSQKDTFLPKLLQRFDASKSCLEEGASPKELLCQGTKHKELRYYFSFCVSLFHVSESSLGKMFDEFNNYAPYLEDKRIYDDFLACLQPLLRKQQISVDTRTLLEELERKIKKVQLHGFTADDLVKRVRPKVVRKVGKATPVKGTPARSSNLTPPKGTPSRSLKRVVRPAKGVRGKKARISSDEEDESD